MYTKYKKINSLKNTVLFVAALMIGLLGVEGLAAENHKHGKMNHTSKDHSMKSKPERKPLSEATKKSVLSVLKINEKLHNAFYNYEAKKVEALAVNLKKSITAIKDKEIKKLLNFSKSKLSEIKASSDRKTNNKNYHLVSMALIHIINTYDIGTKYNAYSCPMVKKKWIQNSHKMSKVHNPYAPNMPNCGSKDSSY